MEHQLSPLAGSVTEKPSPAFQAFSLTEEEIKGLFHQLEKLENKLSPVLNLSREGRGKEGGQDKVEQSAFVERITSFAKEISLATDRVAELIARIEL